MQTMKYAFTRLLHFQNYVSTYLKMTSPYSGFDVCLYGSLGILVVIRGHQQWNR